MSKVILVANMVNQLVYDASAKYIGIDSGAFYLLEKGIVMDFAIGDFDSITPDQLRMLKKSTKTIELPVEKNETDSEYAIRFACKQYDEVLITGVMGGRIDHFLSIYHLLIYNDLQFTIFDQQNTMYKVNQGIHRITKTKKYLSLFALKESLIQITEVKYPLKDQVLNKEDIYTVSNEVLANEAMLEIQYGTLLIVESDDKQHNSKKTTL